MAVRTENRAIATAITKIKEGAWVYQLHGRRDGRGGRDHLQGQAPHRAPSPARRSRLVGAQGKLRPDWWHFCFLTDLGGTAVELDTFHRYRRCRLAIKDLREVSG